MAAPDLAPHLVARRDGLMAKETRNPLEEAELKHYASPKWVKVNAARPAAVLLDNGMTVELVQGANEIPAFVADHWYVQAITVPVPKKIDVLEQKVADAEAALAVAKSELSIAKHEALSEDAAARFDTENAAVMATAGEPDRAIPRAQMSPPQAVAPPPPSGGQPAPAKPDLPRAPTRG